MTHVWAKSGWLVRAMSASGSGKGKPMKRLRTCGLVLFQLSIMTAIGAAGPGTSDRGPGARAETSRGEKVDITSLSLEQLANVTVTSVSKKQESLEDAAAAIYVITGEQIRRSGLSSLPEVLRLAPGLTVQQLNSHAWTVSTRGFNGFPNEKMLVLIDGRSAYDPLSGGVYWDVQDVRLADIDRIEVIRGPGGALWGGNAVNGVINIISKPAAETEGVSTDASLGNGEGYQGSFRFGARVGESFSYRIYGKTSFWDPAVTQSGVQMFNRWHMSNAGIRADWDVDTNNNLSIDVAGYQGHIRDAQWVADYGNYDMVKASYEVAGGHALARWRRTFSARSRTDTLAYCDWTNRTLSGFGGEYRTTCDIEFQHDYSLSRRHSFIWGADFRSTADQTPDTGNDHLTPSDQRLNFFGGFGQYDLSLVPSRLNVTVGAKFEHSTYGGFDALPQVRAMWNPAGSHHFWAAVSRTSRIPTRNEHDNALSWFLPPLAPDGPPVLIVYTGNPNIHNEYQTAYEAGYRYQHRQRWSLDVAAFYNSYSDLIFPDLFNARLSFNPLPAYLQMDTTFTNGTPAQTHGLELSNKWMVARWWRLDLNVTENRGTAFSMYASPRHQFCIQSQIDLPKRLAFDSALYHWNPFTAMSATTVNVPTGNRVDLGLSWRGVHGLSLGVWGRNLQSAEHVEGTGASVATGYVPRSVVVKLGWESNPEKSR